MKIKLRGILTYRDAEGASQAAASVFGAVAAVQQAASVEAVPVGNRGQPAAVPVTVDVDAPTTTILECTAAKSDVEGYVVVDGAETAFDLVIADRDEGAAVVAAIVNEIAAGVGVSPDASWHLCTHDEPTVEPCVARSFGEMSWA